MVLAAWRLSFLLHAEEGPFGLVQKFRERFGVEHDDQGPVSYPAGSVLACIGCLSVWMGLLLFLLPRGISWVLAISAGAIFMEVGRKYLNG